MEDIIEDDDLTEHDDGRQCTQWYSFTIDIDVNTTDGFEENVLEVNCNENVFDG